jgi:hypothetical protein
MNKEDAKQVVLEELKKYKALPYAQLRDFVIQGKIEAYDIVRGNTTYNIEILFFWDSHRKKQNIRVIGNVNVSGGWSAYKPHTESFIVRPDGSFVE